MCYNSIMKILVVGNVVKDVYLKIDSKTENLEKDNQGTDWLDLSFDASEHHFFNRTSSYGGAAISLEVLQKLGLPATLAESDFHFDETGPVPSAPTETYRYILTTDSGVAYFTPKELSQTFFTTPTVPIDYLYIDRSAALTSAVIDRINSYLNFSKTTKLILYVKDEYDHSLIPLIHRANLIFHESTPVSPEYRTAPTSRHSLLKNFPEDRIIHLSDYSLSYQTINEPLQISQLETLTRLSAYSIIAATILGGFILGKTVEYSLRMARINAERSSLSASLSYPELEDLALHALSDNLELTARSLMVNHKGLLAIDESAHSIEKKFQAFHIDNTFENRHTFRDLFLTIDGIENSLSGIILADETARDRTSSGQTYPDYLTARRIVPGVKADQGLDHLDNSSETITRGLENIPIRLREYYQMGLRFVKWRAPFRISLDNHGNIITPSDLAVRENCRRLAEFAKDAELIGLVPIVEPEILYDGDHSIEVAAAVTSLVLDNLFEALHAYEVNLRACILKTSMVLAGKDYMEPSTPDEVGRMTAKVLKDHVPEALAGIVFLSGGQTPTETTDNLAAIIKNGPFPWPISFSFARALTDPALEAWSGHYENLGAAREAFLNRLAANAEVLKAQE